MEMCKQIVGRHFGHAVKKGKQAEFKDDSTIYRFLEDDESNALNAGLSSLCDPRPGPEVAEELRRLVLKLYGQFLSKDGKVKCSRKFFLFPCLKRLGLRTVMHLCLPF